MLKKQIIKKHTIGNFIDILYDVAIIQRDFYRVLILCAGIFFLATIFADNYTSNILLSGVSVNQIEDAFSTGKIASSLLAILIAYKCVEVVIYGLTCADSFNIRLYKIIGTICGICTLTVVQKFSNIISLDHIIFFIAYFLILKLVLLEITKIFYIDTRNFGSYMKPYKNNINISVDRERYNDDTEEIKIIIDDTDQTKADTPSK